METWRHDQNMKEQMVVKYQHMATLKINHQETRMFNTDGTDGWFKPSNCDGLRI